MILLINCISIYGEASVITSLWIWLLVSAPAKPNHSLQSILQHHRYYFIYGTHKERKLGSHPVSTATCSSIRPLVFRDIGGDCVFTDHYVFISMSVFIGLFFSLKNITYILMNNLKC